MVAEINKKIRLERVMLAVIVVGLLLSNLFAWYVVIFDTSDSFRNIFQNSSTQAKQFDGSTDEGVMQIETYLKEIFAINPIEKSTVAEITNLELLKAENAEFYKYAKQGDLIFVFSELGILFRPDTAKIINVISFNDKTSQENKTN